MQWRRQAGESDPLPPAQGDSLWKGERGQRKEKWGSAVRAVCSHGTPTVEFHS